jgi:lipopolysaccharide/colanic/teichoic acid biosynthesis glycosyltransferase
MIAPDGLCALQSEPDRPERGARSALARQQAADDAARVQRFLGGDTDAFAEIMSVHRGPIHTLALSFLKNHADAEEITQDTFIRAHRGLLAFRGDSSLATWLHRIALNLARNRYWYFHRRRRHVLAVTKVISPGPILFRQERVGWRGRRFHLYKFRTMSVGADTAVHRSYVRQLMASNAPMVKLDARRDARLIPGGRWLRASGLDELPQLINVLRGEMSLVGPRPCLPGEFDHVAPTEGGARSDAVPGLTGLWQVSGKNRTTFQEMIRLDVHYARHVSLLLDLKIIVLTPLVLARQLSELRLKRTLPLGSPVLAPVNRVAMFESSVRR